MSNRIYEIRISSGHLPVILSALEVLPFKQVYQIMASITQQVRAADAASAEAAKTPSEDAADAAN